MMLESPAFACKQHVQLTATAKRHVIKEGKVAYFVILVLFCVSVVLAVSDSSKLPAWTFGV